MNQLFSVYEHDKEITVKNHPSHPGENSYTTIHPNRRIIAFIDWIDLDISVGSRIKIYDIIYTIIGKGILKNWYGRIDKASISVVRE